MMTKATRPETCTTPITKLERRNGIEYWAAGSLMGSCYQDIGGGWHFRPEEPPSYSGDTTGILVTLRTSIFSCEASVHAAALIWANEQRFNGWL